jgi:dihydrofolate reductase
MYDVARAGFDKFGPQGTKTVVVSCTLRPEDHPKVKIISELKPETVASLRAEAKKDIWLFGGGELFGWLMSLR